MPITKQVGFIFTCVHCGKNEEILIEDISYEDDPDISDFFPEGWVTVHGEILFKELLKRREHIESTYDYDRKSFKSEDKVFCSLEHAIDHTTYELDQLRENK